jgi:cell division protein FtsB
MKINGTLTRPRLVCGMVIYKRLRSTLYPLLLYCVSGSIGAYFVWHALNGERGLKTKDEYEHKIAALRDELEGLKSEHAQWEQRIALLSGRVIDRDLLDEQARALLGRSSRNDLVVLLPRTEK